MENKEYTVCLCMYHNDMMLFVSLAITLCEQKKRQHFVVVLLPEHVKLLLVVS